MTGPLADEPSFELGEQGKDPSHDLTRGGRGIHAESRGEFTFGQHSPEIAQSFEEAEAMTFGAPRPIGVFDGFRRLVRTLTDSNAAS